MVWFGLVRVLLFFVALRRDVNEGVRWATMLTVRGLALTVDDENATIFVQN